MELERENLRMRLRGPPLLHQGSKQQQQAWFSMSLNVSKFSMVENFSVLLTFFARVVSYFVIRKNDLGL